jgi:uncharacterized membrane protein YeaQ/YmgE (transglycosylase-associated protein family)
VQTFTLRAIVIFSKKMKAGGDVMDLIWNALVGVVVGVLAKMIMKSGPSGFLLTACLGIAGSIVGTFIGQMLGLYKGGDIAGFVASLLGAVALLWGYGKFIAKK